METASLLAEHVLDVDSLMAGLETLGSALGLEIETGLKCDLPQK